VTRRLGALLAASALLAVATGCGISESKLYAKLGKHSCAKAFECDAEAAEEAWGSEEACRTAFEEEASETRKVYRACKYKRKKARKYVRAYKKIDCSVSASEADELASAWDDVYDCEGGEEGGTAADTGSPPAATGGL